MKTHRTWQVQMLCTNFSRLQFIYIDPIYSKSRLLAQRAQLKFNFAQQAKNDSRIVMLFTSFITSKSFILVLNVDSNRLGWLCPDDTQQSGQSFSDGQNISSDEKDFTCLKVLLQFNLEGFLPAGSAGENNTDF